MVLDYLLISGSPRNGNTDFVLGTLYKLLRGNKEIIFLRNHQILHCVGCCSCRKKPVCILKDDMPAILAKMQQARVLILGTPNYFDNVTGIFKDFIDRTHPFYKPQILKETKLVMIMVGGGDIKGSAKYLKETTAGFVKYQKLKLVKSYCFQADGANDLKRSSGISQRLARIAQKISGF